MSQINWTYVDDFGRKYNVGLYHGNRTGHLLVYCNKKILLIDFNVLQSKKYTFFLDGELCDLHIEKKNGKFGYGFEIDEKTSTPLNVKRRKSRRSDNLNSLALILVLILIITMVVFLMF